MIIAAAVVFAAGCANLPDAPPADFTPREVSVPAASAPGISVEENDKAVIDYSNSSDGYIMAKYRIDTPNMINVLVDGPGGEQYVYIVAPGDFAVFPLTEGNGRYVVTLCEQVDEMKLKVVVKAHIDVSISDPLAPFLRPSQHVNYSKESAVTAKAAEITAGARDLIGVISAVFNFVTGNLSYDTELAQTVESGYLPDLDAVLAKGKGICFDYAAVMTAMLRSLGIPTKLVFGYVGEYYHAWISVYSEEEGWIGNVIFFDGQDWILMDPTLTSGAGQSGLSQYIGDGVNYVAKFHY